MSCGFWRYVGGMCMLAVCVRVGIWVCMGGYVCIWPAGKPLRGWVRALAKKKTARYRRTTDNKQRTTDNRCRRRIV